MRSERKRTDFHLPASFEKKKKKKALLAIQIYALATSLLPPPPPPFHLSFSIQVASVDDQGIKSLRGWGRNRGEQEGKGKREERERERERGSKRLSLHISPAPPRRASQPAVCSPLSFLFYHSTEKKKKINSYFHNPHFCLSTCLCPPPPSSPSPSLFRSPSLSLSPSPSPLG